MGAVVFPKCGHASHLMEVDLISEAPQIHLHFLTDSSEFDLTNFLKAEICCHGCGTSVLLYYGEQSNTDTRHLVLKDEFVKSHKSCPNRKYEDNCPNFRSTVSIVDIRMPTSEINKSI